MRLSLPAADFASPGGRQSEILSISTGPLCSCTSSQQTLSVLFTYLVLLIQHKYENNKGNSWLSIQDTTISISKNMFQISAKTYRIEPITLDKQPVGGITICEGPKFDVVADRIVCILGGVIDFQAVVLRLTDFLTHLTRPRMTSYSYENDKCDPVISILLRESAHNTSSNKSIFTLAPSSRSYPNRSLWHSRIVGGTSFNSS